MKRLRWLAALMLITLSTWLLDSCSFSVQVLRTPLAPPPTTAQTSLPFTATAVPPTALLPSVTPTLISIRADTINMIEIFRSFGLKESVRSLAFTPDGKVLAAAGGDTEDFAIHLWDVASGREIGNLVGHSGIVWGAVFSPDGQMLASV